MLPVGGWGWGFGGAINTRGRSSCVAVEEGLGDVEGKQRITTGDTGYPGVKPKPPSVSGVNDSINILLLSDLILLRRQSNRVDVRIQRINENIDCYQ